MFKFFMIIIIMFSALQVIVRLLEHIEPREEKEEFWKTIGGDEKNNYMFIWDNQIPGILCYSGLLIVSLICLIW